MSAPFQIVVLAFARCASILTHCARSFGSRAARTPNGAVERLMTVRKHQIAVDDSGCGSLARGGRGRDSRGPTLLGGDDRGE
eukprot:625747-Pyramimonas_sp.AAC.1